MIMVAADGENLIAVSPGANATVGAAQVECAASLVGPGTVLLCQLEVPLDAVVATARRARAAGGLVVINPSPVPSAGTSAITELLSLTDVLVVNETEARTLTALASPSGSASWTTGAPDGGWSTLAARALRDLGCGSVVITMGERGCLILGPDGEHRVPAVEVTSVDAVAAGDSFLGALVCEIGRGATLTEAARVGSAAGALAVGRRGAQSSIPHRVEIEAVLAAGRVG